MLTLTRRLLPQLDEAAFEEYRPDRDHREKIAAARVRGEKLATELPNSITRCLCGATFDSHKPEESLPHRRHIYAGQAVDGISR